MAHIAVIDTWHYLSFHNLFILWKKSNGYTCLNPSYSTCPASCCSIEIHNDNEFLLNFTCNCSWYYQHIFIPLTNSEAELFSGKNVIFSKRVKANQFVLTFPNIGIAKRWRFLPYYVARLLCGQWVLNVLLGRIVLKHIASQWLKCLS